MGIFNYKNKNYFVETFHEDCICVKRYPLFGFRQGKLGMALYQPNCKVCRGCGVVAVTRWFKEVESDPRSKKHSKP